jgi:hypothetical protein
MVKLKILLQNPSSQIAGVVQQENIRLRIEQRPRDSSFYSAWALGLPQHGKQGTKQYKNSNSSQVTGGGEDTSYWIDQIYRYTQLQGGKIQKRIVDRVAVFKSFRKIHKYFE